MPELGSTTTSERITLCPDNMSDVIGLFHVPYGATVTGLSIFKTISVVVGVISRMKYKEDRSRRDFGRKKRSCERGRHDLLSLSKYLG
jgi:hypothetical protein